MMCVYVCVLYNSFTVCTRRLLSAIPLLKARLEKLPICDNISIAFPDDGAFKRFNFLLPTWPTIICSKIRDGEKRIVTIKDGNILTVEQNLEACRRPVVFYFTKRV